MAVSKNPILKHFKGHINKQVVIKQYSDNRTIITAYPNMSKVKPSEAQSLAKSNFAQGVSYAKETINDSEKKSLADIRLSQRNGTLYHALIAEYIFINGQKK